MASHFAPAARPRSLANVLADLREARDDLDAAFADKHQDRISEAETRLSDLQDDLADRFQDVTGLTIEEWRKAFAEALI